MLMNRNSMAWAHSSNMAPLETAMIQCDKALLNVIAVRGLQERYTQN